METPAPKIVVIVGPTASGKTALAVRLGKTFTGEVISADSRQVYRSLDLGTGKLTEEEAEGIPHHLIDVADPAEVYTAADFVRDADHAIADIARRGKLPIVAGGTFFYVEALLGTKRIADVPANEPLRRELERRTPDALYAELAEKDPAYAAVVDRRNPHRLVRALEIIEALGAMPTPIRTPRYDALVLGVDVPKETLNAKISLRLRAHLDAGMLEETRALHAAGLPYARMESLGLEYRYMARHLQGLLSYDEMVTVLDQKIRQFAKRQRTWLRKMDGVRWYAPEDTTGIEDAVRAFLA